jgi:NAD(P)H-nitrite reductase large subunit
MDENIIICRCEDVTAGDVYKLIAMGIDTPEEIKRITRCGMGTCQGLTCQGILQNLLKEKTGKSLENLKIHKFRPPSKPVFLGVFGGYKNEK